MNHRLEILLFSMTTCIAVFLFLGMRRSAIRGGFVILWMTICFGVATLPFLEHAYKILSTVMGFNYASDMLTMFAILFLLLYGFYLTVKLLRVQDATEVLLSRFAILESRCELMHQQMHPAPTESIPSEKGVQDL